MSRDARGYRRLPGGVAGDAALLAASMTGGG